MPPRLDQLPKGHRLPPVPVHLSPDWVREYVAAVEDAAIAEIDGDAVPPMAAAALAVRSLLESARLPEGAVHIGQELEFRRPLRLGERLTASATVAARGERAGWLLMSVDLSLQDEARSLVMTARATVTMPAGGPA